MAEVEYVKIELPDLSRVELAPGDILIYQSPAMIGQAAAEAIKARLGKVLSGHCVLVLEDGAKLAVLRPVE